MSNTNKPIAAASSAAEGRGGSQAPEERHILTPVRQREDWPKTVEGNQPLRRITVLDTETTGLDWRRHSIIEIAVARVLVDAAGHVVGIERTGSSVNDPGHPLSPEIIALTGLTNEMVAGKAINGEQLAAFLADGEAVVAFNAAFDRPFVDSLLPDLPPMPWGCAMADVPWRRLGFEPGPQGYLLMQAGKFAPRAHRAMDDVLALLELLDHVCGDGETVMAKVLAAIDGKAWRIEATSAPYQKRDQLWERRYRFRKEMRGGGVWHKHVRPDELEAEFAWYRETIGKEPSLVELPATERYRADSTWTPVVPKVNKPIVW
ncbi:3'-5' exonuclease [Porphyrobacter sp. YT40]|uniref:3'-5' exonuclease n=1 Tax=Porphyrobacter sp. YT40 TaxID=2547601 RepID=UPI001143CAC3|nr:3'-5' exonuclease [Porphyrobacter sp. YT40]QDH35111.1 DNA polymerase III subunit epsilon [Porphyrobacter sp. YT40]